MIVAQTFLEAVHLKFDAQMMSLHQHSQGNKMHMITTDVNIHTIHIVHQAINTAIVFVYTIMESPQSTI
jgi:hypothetical protein